MKDYISISSTAAKQPINSGEKYIDSTEELLVYLGWLSDAVGDTNGGSNSTLRLTQGSSFGDVVRIKNGNCNDNDTSSSIDLDQMHMFELDANCDLILQGRIGQGFYGEVFRGTIERVNYEGDKDEPQQVAVKKLKAPRVEADLRDFEREISIMKVTFTKSLS